MAVGLEGVAVFWFKDNIEKKVRSVEQKRMSVAALEAGQIEFASLQRDYQLVQEFLPRLESALPNTEQLFSVLQEMDRIAERTDNKQTLVVEGQSPQPSGLGNSSFIAFSAKLNASYQSLRNYLQELRRAPFFVKIESISFTSSDSISNKSLVNITGKLFLK